MFKFVITSILMFIIFVTLFLSKWDKFNYFISSFSFWRSKIYCIKSLSFSNLSLMNCFLLLFLSLNWEIDYSKNSIWSLCCLTLFSKFWLIYNTLRSTMLVSTNYYLWLSSSFWFNLNSLWDLYRFFNILCSLTIF